MDADDDIRVGDFVLFSDGVLRRVAHLYSTVVQTCDLGDFNLDIDVVRMSGSLSPGITRDTLTPTGLTQLGEVPFHHHDQRATCALVRTQVVRIMLNPDPLAAWFGYRPGVPVYPAFSYLSSGTDHGWLCEQAWQVGNYDGHTPGGDPVDGLDADELETLISRLIDPHTRELAAVYQRRTERSLQAGDVVAIHDNFYACAGLGWEPIDEPFVGHGPIPSHAFVDLSEAMAARRKPDLLDDAA